MSYEIVVKNTKKIETILNNMGAKGSGLYEKSLSIENKLDKKTLNSIRFIATIRNKLLHEDGFELSDKTLKDFLNQCSNVNSILNKTIVKKSQNYCQVTNDALKDKPYLRNVILDKQPKIIKTNNQESNLSKNIILIIIFLSVLFIVIK